MNKETLPTENTYTLKELYHQAEALSQRQDELAAVIIVSKIPPCPGERPRYILTLIPATTSQQAFADALTKANLESAISGDRNLVTLPHDLINEKKSLMELLETCITQSDLEAQKQHNKLAAVFEQTGIDEYQPLAEESYQELLAGLKEHGIRIKLAKGTMNKCYLNLLSVSFELETDRLG